MLRPFTHWRGRLQEQYRVKRRQDCKTKETCSVGNLFDFLLLTYQRCARWHWHDLSTLFKKAMIIPLVALLVVIIAVIGFLVFSGKKKSEGGKLGERGKTMG